MENFKYIDLNEEELLHGIYYYRTEYSSKEEARNELFEKKSDLPPKYIP